MTSRQSFCWGLLAAVLSILLWVLSIPPFEFAEAAYITFVPLLLWLFTRPSNRCFWSMALAVGWVSWFAILIWLRHVTWFGTFALSLILTGFFVLWLFAARLLFPLLVDRGVVFRTIGSLGLAGLWVVLEWVRSWFLWGFPWAPLALSQWERPVVLQIAAWTGAYGVSFLLVFFNCCIAHTMRSRFVRRESRLWLGWFSPDLYLGIGGLGLCVYIFFQSLPHPGGSKELFTAGVVQPYIAPELKWDTDRELENLEILERQTRFVSSLENDIILWPEASTPWPVIGYVPMQSRVLDLSAEIEKPILMGTLAYEQEADVWYNGVALAYPDSRMNEIFYAKRELVPFGEYVPPPFGIFVEKFVDFEGSFLPGDGPELISLILRGRELRIGSLVCYEDVFPSLARESAQAGAQLFFVTTNNAWFGEEGGAEQHAAHSVLRAVENRRPVMRIGNGGWSGWIDAYGTVRQVLFDESGSIYFRGGGTYTVSHFEEWMRGQSFYTRHGDWFVGLSGFLALLSLSVFFLKGSSSRSRVRIEPEYLRSRKS